MLHVEQEVAGGDETVLDAVLACDSERTELLKEEALLLAQVNKVRLQFFVSASKQSLA